MSKRFIDVAAGLLLTHDGQLLLAQRPGDKPWSGWWELPGGKIEPGESASDALVRELHEELGIHVTELFPWVTYTHEYPKTIVRLAFHRVTGWEGTPTGVEGQSLAWTPITQTPSVGPLLPATEPPLRWLQLPNRYLLTSIGTQENLEPFLNRLTRALEQGVRLVQFREPDWAKRTDPASQTALYAAFERVVQVCRRYDAACLVNSAHPAAWADEADGIHYRAEDAATLAASVATAGSADADVVPPPAVPSVLGADADEIIDTSRWASAAAGEPGPPASDKALPGAQRLDRYVAVSAHNAAELSVARRLNADFALVGHVLDTPSHPGKPGMGWSAFGTLNSQAGLPVFAIGGQSESTMPDAMRAGAHGIAGIRMLSELHGR